MKDRGDRSAKASEVRGYAIGYALALALTLAAFALVEWPQAAGVTTLALILILALAQMVVHFRFFLHVTLASDVRDRLLLILFSAFIVALMASGTLVILFNLRMRMM